MINYDLAKRLKDAGFLFKEWDIAEHYGADSELQWDDENWEYPLLSELIEACRKFGRIKLMTNTIYPHMVGREIDYLTSEAKCEFIDGSYIFFPDYKIGFGNNPEEAVANLWIALNEK